MGFDYESFEHDEFRECEHPDCMEEGIYRAPKSRGNLRDYHWFCLDHVRAYNRSWNYCAGMTEAEIEDEIRRSTVWERPTWRTAVARDYEQHLRRTIRDSGGFYGYGPGEYPGPRAPLPPTPEGRALGVLGLEGGVTFRDIKIRYRELVKQHHPDRHSGDKLAEEKLKTINQAFNTLKRAHEADKVA